MVGGRGGQERADAQGAQVEVGVVPAHPVQQLRQLGCSARGDEELGPAVRGRGDRPERQAHPLEADQRAAPGLLRDLDDVEGAAHGEQDRGARVPAPGLGDLVEGGAGRDGRCEGQWMRPRRAAIRMTAGAVADGGRGAGAGDHVPAPQPGVLRDRRALRRPAAAPRAGTELLGAAAAADREAHAHAPSNGSDAPVVTTSAGRDAGPGRARCPEGPPGALLAACAPGALPSNQSFSPRCQVNRAWPVASSFEGVANGGVSGIDLAAGVIVGLLSVHQTPKAGRPWLCRRQRVEDL